MISHKNAISIRENAFGAQNYQLFSDLQVLVGFMYLLYLGRCGRKGREGMESVYLASSRVTVC